MRRAPRMREYSQEAYPPHYVHTQQPSPAPTDYWQDVSPQNRFSKEGATGPPEMTNGFGMHAPSSPLAMITGNLGLSSPTIEPDLPFANGQNNYDLPFATGFETAPPTLPSLSPEWSPVVSSSDLSPSANVFRNSFGSLERSPQAGMGPNWPPANVFHGGGYAAAQ